ncbi:hypothetical protein BRADI_2g25455v3 [Brachypodium distachyon]|uniref:Secreted protein n=1 Tax=Brachypodium distachyon TaxID=15368 RepID=A0A0Q3J0T6_BRADI|nr:hypothetical protein BRADI_2g25455v3 [Brachypodium distachyon]
MHCTHIWSCVCCNGLRLWWLLGCGGGGDWISLNDACSYVEQAQPCRGHGSEELSGKGEGCQWPPAN